MRLKEYLKETILITDGAMGTYYAAVSNQGGTFSEFANLSDTAAVRAIHEEYIAAGAKLIRTNTFSANGVLVGEDKVAPIIRAGVAAARAAAKDVVFVAASIGPIPEMADGQAVPKERIQRSYEQIADLFLDEKINIFIFETFGSLDYLDAITRYIKSKDPEAFILAQFALTLSGVTRRGIGAAALTKGLGDMPGIDAYGFNCGIGPYHLYHVLKTIDLGEAIISALPNAGYPQIVNERTVFSADPAYFAEWMTKTVALGARIVGGCCGTTPAHIRAIAEALRVPALGKAPAAAKQATPEKTPPRLNRFAEGITSKQAFLVAVELDSPMDTDIRNFMTGAAALKRAGADIITIADSPLARPRIDAITLAAKIKREIDIDAMPHLCCRDRNIIALRAALLGGYISDIRNLLVITGDAIASPDRHEIKSVFNVNSYQLMRLIQEMNKEKFEADPFCYGGAININTLNPDAELRRVEEKLSAGARFFLTQPVFEDRAIALIERIHEVFPEIRVLTGIMPIVSYNNARFLANEIPGMSVPEAVIARFSATMSREAASVVGQAIAVETAKKVRAVSDGYYFITPFHRYEMIGAIIAALRNPKEKVE